MGGTDRLEKVNRFRWVLDKLGGVSSNREIDHDILDDSKSPVRFEDKRT